MPRPQHNQTEDFTVALEALQEQNWGRDETLLLIDAQHMAYRAFYTRDLSTMDGEQTSVLHGILDMIQATCEAANSSRFLLVWDGADGLHYRRAVYPQYKNRHDRDRTEEEAEEMHKRNRGIDNAKIGLKQLGIPQIYIKTLECDDTIGIIASMVGRAIRSGGKMSKLLKRVVVVSDDKDFMQLLSEEIFQWRGIIKRFITPEVFRATHGFDPKYYADYKALVGEGATGDNIPGIKGVGPKTAEKLIAMNKTIEKVIAFCQKQTSQALKPLQTELAICNGADIARLSYKLSRIHRSVYELPVSCDVPECSARIAKRLKQALSVPRKISLTAIVQFRGQWEFASLQTERFSKALGFKVVH